MPHVKGSHPGALWRKTDLQVHTPRDAQWSGMPSLPGGNPADEKAREDWADSFVAECLKRGIGAIGITDHHDLVMYPYIQRAIERLGAERDKLWLFPGMEVTCDDSVQCLALFDQGTPPEIVRRLFPHAPKVLEPDSNAAHAPQAELCGKDIKEFLGSTYDDIAFRGRMIVLPHASKGGHKSILRRGFHPRFADLQVDGVYTEKPYASLDAETLKKLYGESKEWGERRRGIITTGDNRSESYDRLGINECWIRLGEPTAEGIRQAVLADEARITYAKPDIPSHRVLEFRVSSTLTGSSFRLLLNDGFNALIGGRGSGKSAILEYLRFGLGRSIVDMPDETSQERERGLIETTLVGGYVEVVLERDGIQETWRRDLTHSGHIIVKAAGSEPTNLTIAAAQERFRARAFYQKQLSTLVRQRETADDQITGIAAAELVDRRQQCEREIEEAERTVHAGFQSVVQGWSAEFDHDRAKINAADLQRRLASIRERLQSEGLSSEQQAVLDQGPAFSRIDNQFASLLSTMQTQLVAVDDATDLGVSWDISADFPEIGEAQAILKKANGELANLRSSIKQIMENAIRELQKSQMAFSKRYAAFKSSHEEATKAQAHLGTLLADHKRVASEIEQAERLEQGAGTSRQKFSGAEAKLSEARKGLSDRLTQLKAILSEAASRVETMSDGILRARVEEEISPERYLNAITDLCERCGIREIDLKCTALVEAATKDGAVEWERLVSALVTLRRERMLAGDSAEIDPTLTSQLRSALGLDLTENQARMVLARLDDARLARIISAWAKPFIRFEYKDRGVYMPFERASPGQQASALLTLLLNQEAGTLIVDQPEDDLDNRIIMDVVRLLQRTKRKRQLIFATHNPNFVVNGDADKVVALAPNVEPNAVDADEAARIEIETDGAIETVTVRQAITETMEGGQHAFELRSRKYAFESNPLNSGDDAHGVK